MKNGYYENCESEFAPTDCKESNGCGCQLCYNEFKSGDCPECGSEADIAERAYENMLSDFYGGSAPFTTRGRRLAIVKP